MPASGSNRRRPSATKKAAAATNEATIRSFCVVTDWSANSLRVAVSSAASSEAAREKPIRRASP